MDINAQLQLALKHYQAGNLQQAEHIFRKILKVQPNSNDIYFYIGNILQDKEQLDEAIICYKKEIEINPNYAGAYYNLGAILHEKGQLNEAIACYQKVLHLNPSLADTYNNLGTIFQAKEQFDKAITYYQKAIHINPNYVMAFHNLGIAYLHNGQIDEAITYLHKAIQIKPNDASSYNNLGVALQQIGKLDEAELNFRQAIQIDPNNMDISENILFQMLYNFRYDAQAIYLEHLQFAKKYAEHLSLTISPHDNDKNLYRKLKIGYVSPDFRRHAVSYFIEPAIIEHNREHFEIFCYSNNPIYDEVTQRIQNNVDQWRNIVGKSDQDVTELIREDKIDMLVDLAGHTVNNRILVFARKPAPIQISWIGYLATTGLSAMDYKITDNYSDPLGETEQFHTEKLIRLPENFLCYLPDRESPDVGPLPVLTSGHITFGSFNNFTKVSHNVMELWAKILKAIPSSHLILKAKSFSEKSTIEYVKDMFKQKDIAEGRIELLSWEPSARGHLDTYNRIDIGLDTFPYNGTTTTCESMWMGVPVITLAGTGYASRAGVSLLSNVCLKDFIAKTYDEYINLAVSLASDIDNLRFLRESLRDRMAHSPLTDAKRFIINLEKCYREIWETWCKSVF